MCTENLLLPEIILGLCLLSVTPNSIGLQFGGTFFARTLVSLDYSLDTRTRLHSSMLSFIRLRTAQPLSWKRNCQHLLDVGEANVRKTTWYST